MAAAGSGGQGARDVLEQFGEIVQKKVHNEVHAYREKLKGKLWEAKFDGVSDVPSDPCLLNHKIHTNVTTGKDDPCDRRSSVRFSDESRSQCTQNRIKDSTSGTVGACAPYRRLHVCDQNLEQIRPEQITSTHNLLADVCLAAQHEGNILSQKLQEYDKNNYESRICTVLARSFADIGDIVRGKDLYLGDKKEKLKLEKKLKLFFEKIHGKLTKEAQEYYEDKDRDKNYYKLREHWWNANRYDVWKAMTCGASEDAKYKVIGPDGKITESNMGQCRNVADVPTNIDYVPQYLRWFDEWTEEFCRKRKKQLENAKQQCRGMGEDGKPKYCSLNGCDCKTTVREKKKFDYQQECNDCLVACDPFVHWIDNQELEFLKQKEKYKNEIKEKEPTKQTSHGTNNNMYAEEFYDELENNYGYVKSFLELLNKEKQCENHPEVEVKGVKADHVDFTKEDVGEIFSHTEICEPCPWCGVQEGGPPWIAKHIDSCGEEKIISFSDDDTTDISILSPNKGNQNILEELKDFCRGNKEINYDIWKCHYEEKTEYEDGAEFFMDKIKEAYGKDKCDELMKKIEETKVFQVTGDTEHSNDAIKILLGHELDQAEKCLQRSTQDECLQDSHEEHSDSEDEKEEKDRVKDNPCVSPSGGSTKHREMVTKIAKKLQRQAKKKMRDNTRGSGGISKLTADATKGEYNRQGKGSDLKGDKICNISIKHSNDSRNDNNGEPCYGKDGYGQRFVIGTNWEGGTSVSTTPEIYLPPRRQHMCTSNLENLDVGSVTKGGKASHSLLGDVLLSAKMDAIKIIQKYNNHNVKENLKDLIDEATACRAMKYSFADLGDIIRGRDLWDKDEGSKKMEGHLQKIFYKIKEKLLNSSIKEKYNGDDKTIPKYKQLREDWWEANRSQVWDAMKCSLPNSSIKCGRYPPFEDYIPQRLRWMTEWAEWFCKMQKEAYDKLVEKCQSCKDKIKGQGQCKEGTEECTDCKSSCEKYTEFIKKWKPQWNTMEIQYTPLYLEAQRNFAGNAYLGADYQQMVHFFKELQEANGDTKFGDITSPYFTAAGYIHQELPNVGCMKQDVFCSGKDNYAFRSKPKEYEKACDCENRENTPVPPPPPPPPPPAPAVTVDVCTTVAKIFEDMGSLTKACEQKYGYPQRHWGWRCVAPSGPTSGKSDGSVCVPPRRRKLYLGGFDKFISDKSPQDSPPASTSSRAQDPLLAAFVESAAVETFFLWHRYKKIKDKEKKEKEEQARQNGLLSAAGGLQNIDGTLENSDEKTPEKLLQSDILEGKNIVADILNGSSGGAKHEMAQREEKIKKAIDNYFSKSENQATGDKKPGQTPKDWWNKHGPDIWNAMVCALTYKEKDEKGAEGKNTYKIEQIQDTNGNGDLFEKLKGKYSDYDKVELKEQNDTEAKQTTDSQHGQTTLLSHFVERPTYFRYLEEWGQNFCKERKKRLEKIKEECRGKNGNKKCSGYGEDCEEIFSKKYDTVSSLECPDCAKYCRFYKRWIDRKRKEYDKQENIYVQQKSNYENEQKKGAGRNNDDKQFCVIRETCDTAGDFLEKLKNGPCSKNNENGKDKLDFTNPDKTFVPATNCAPCSQFKIDCQKANCTGAQVEKCNDGKITADNFQEKMAQSTQKLDMLVSDNNTNGFKTVLGECENAHIFKGIRKEQWECGNFCGYVVCKPENANGKNDGTYIIQIRALFKRWVEYFFEDYNKINAKLSHCINNGESECINGCQKKCKCVKKWLELKRTEWQQIKNRLLDQYKYEGQPDYPVTSFLQELIPQIAATIDKGNHNGLVKLVKSVKCNCGNNSQNGKEGEENDLVLCLLEKLGEKAEKCEENPPTCDNSSLSGKESTLVEDVDDYEEQNPENKVGKPAICGNVDTTEQQEEEDDKCEAAAPTDQESEEKPNPEETPVLKPEEEAPPPEVSPPSQPKPKPPIKLLDDPLVIPSLATSTLAWSVGIGFATFTYFYLKKKSKASVGNLFQILQIPKSDYDIPTLESKNRYIPYKSAQYKGKTYIYMEGDADEDKYTFMSDTTDVTSSESEYEELDINDIYAPRAPKYKTLIEVVLEPSGNNTTASGKNTPSDTQNDIPTSDTPPPITDDEWNTLKHDFISNMLQNEPNDIPNDYKSRDIPLNTQPNTLYFDNNQEKPFITSIHDRNLYSGEEISYNINMSTNSMDDPKYVSNNVYSGIDLINDTLSGNQPIDIYDELLKRKENELFGTNHVKQTSIHSVAKPARDDPIHNQLELFHKWLDRHRDMCEKWENHHERLAKLKEEWENETHSGNTHPSGNTPPTSDIPSGKLSDIPSDNNIHSDIHPSDIPSGKQSDTPSDNNIPSSNQILNTDVSIQIHMDNPKPINQFTNMDTILEDLDKYNEPYYDVQDDIYYDVHDHDASTVDTNAMDVPSKVQIEMDVNTKLVKEKYPIADVWDI
ncbi:erythrocyte membrane protein 1 [Plasmodium falciparum RAJ116]|uniref:Erythrocyte membrane protein 1 n=1 Tax=Plasmodium falciparum RAJ116 TaxID=580058 RepID=A0A0L0CUT1_PLAFA|nr:erythrocyte membrane protein 1 [Plasmodium falciparum RAJ116]